MAYEPKDWVCGDIVSAEALNNIERGIADIMSDYVPTEWSCGDVITAEKMNKIEQGIANADCGGSSSDFSTATVACNDMSAIRGCFASTLPGSVDASYYFGEFGNQVILYKGCAFIDINDSVAGTSGAIEQIEGSTYLVTGDCTITIAGSADDDLHL